MIFNIEKKNNTVLTSRVNEVMTDFDIKMEHSHEIFTGELDIENKPWTIGLIVGGSGSGKSTIAKEIFKDNYIRGYDYDENSVLDNMPTTCSVKEIEKAFTSVGFSSPPSWLKPYNVLSTGEKMRVDLARSILLDNDLIVFDEFTSVVDREVAKTCSLAIQKEMRRKNKKFVAVTCHSDIIEYLSPDWIYDMDQKRFFGLWGNMSSRDIKSTYTRLADSISSKYGKYLGSITI